MESVHPISLARSNHNPSILQVKGRFKRVITRSESVSLVEVPATHYARANPEFEYQALPGLQDQRRRGQSELRDALENHYNALFPDFLTDENINTLCELAERGYIDRRNRQIIIRRSSLIDEDALLQPLQHNRFRERN